MNTILHSRIHRSMATSHERIALIKITCLDVNDCLLSMAVCQRAWKPCNKTEIYLPRMYLIAYVIAKVPDQFKAVHFELIIYRYVIMFCGCRRGNIIRFRNLEIRSRASFRVGKPQKYCCAILDTSINHSLYACAVYEMQRNLNLCT